MTTFKYIFLFICVNDKILPLKYILHKILCETTSRLKSLYRWQPYPWGSRDIGRLNEYYIVLSVALLQVDLPTRPSFGLCPGGTWIKFWKTSSGSFWPTGAGPLLIFLQQNLRFQFRLSSHSAEKTFFFTSCLIFFAHKPKLLTTDDS